MEKIREFFHHRLVRSLIGTFLGSFIYCFSIVYILNKCEFYAGGISGISQILALKVLNIPALQSVFIAGFNIPLFIVGWKKVSKRFAVLSLLSVGLQTLLIYLFQLAYDAGFDPFKGLLYEVEATNGEIVQVGKITLAVIGGILCGAGCAIPLRCGASTGGTDIISQAFAFNSNMPFTYISGTIDAVIIVVGTILGGNISVGVYTIIRLIVHVITLDKIHTIYKFQKVTIITDKPDEITKEILAHYPHGITIYKATGAFSKTEKFVLESVIFTYELDDYRHIVKENDKNAFIYYTAIKGIDGKFTRRAIS